MNAGEILAQHDFIKTSSLAVPALENLGLGILAAPSIAGIAGHPINENAKEVAEVGGLGVLAAHPTYELANHYLPESVKNRIGQTASNVGGHVLGGTAGLATRASQGIGNVVNKFRSAAPVLSKLAYNSFYQEILK